MRFYVYLYRDPWPAKGLVPIYVGKGLIAGSRAYKHLLHTHNLIFGRILAQCRKDGIECMPEIVLETDNEAEAFGCERKLIAQYGRLDLKTGTLCNLTDGGEGGTGISTVTREKKAALLRGKPMSEETKAKIAATRKGQKRTRESVEKSAAALRGRKLSREHIGKVVAAKLGVPRSEEQKMRMGFAQKRRRIRELRLGVDKRKKKAQVSYRDDASMRPF